MLTSPQDPIYVPQLMYGTMSTKFWFPTIFLKSVLSCCHNITYVNIPLMTTCTWSCQMLRINEYILIVNTNSIE